MTFALPWFLITLVFVYIYLWLWRSTERKSVRFFSGGFLVTPDLKSSGVGRERRRTLEKWLACLVLLLLSILGAQPVFYERGKLILTDGPLPIGSVATQDRVIRAGTIPSAVPWMERSFLWMWSLTGGGKHLG